MTREMRDPAWQTPRELHRTGAWMERKLRAARPGLQGASREEPVTGRVASAGAAGPGGLSAAAALLGGDPAPQSLLWSQT